MKVLFTVVFTLFSVSSFAAMTIVRCDLHRQGFQEYSYVTYFQPELENRAIQIVKGSGIYSYYKLPVPNVVVANGNFVSNVHGMDGDISLVTTDKILNDPTNPHFPGIAKSEGGDETMECYRLQPQQVRRFKELFR